MLYSALTDLIIAVPGYIGMFLGAYNFYHHRKKLKVNIKIIPKAVQQRMLVAEDQESFLTSAREFNFKYIDKHFCIEIVNLSHFPVIIQKVGFFIRGESGKIVIAQPIVLDDQDWPRRLGQRETVVVYGPVTDFLKSPRFPHVVSAFAETTCGEVGTGSSRALKGLVAYSKSLHARRRRVR